MDNATPQNRFRQGHIFGHATGVVCAQQFPLFTQVVHRSPTVIALMAVDVCCDSQPFPDLIIMDIIMSERTEGSFTVQEVRKTMELIDIPIFVVSSLYSGDEDFRTSPDSAWLTHDEFFSKPLNTLQLLEKIRQRLKNGGQARRSTVLRQAES